MNHEDVIDGEIIAEVKEDLEEDFEDFLEQFFNDADEWVRELRTGVEAGDADLVYQRAHTLKSSCGYLGAIYLQETARQLEARGREGDVSGCENLALDAKEQLLAVRTAVESSWV